MVKPLYFYNGTTFEQIGPTVPQSPIAYQTSAPTGPATGDLWIDSDGDVDTYNRQLTRFYFVATAGQTSVSGADANNLTLAYTPGSEQVYINGVLQVRGVDYTATNGTSITGLSALVVNDVVEVFAYTAFTVANAYTKSETDGIAAAAAGMRMVVPTSVAVGSGTGSVDANGAVTFTTVSSISLNGCFTSTYDNYKLVLTVDSNSAINVTTFRMRASGTDNSESVYRYGGNLRNWAGTLDYTNSTGTTSFPGLSLRTTYTNFSSEFNFFNPFRSVPTTYSGISWYQTGSNDAHMAINGHHNKSVSYDGLSLIVDTGTITGTVRVYGYKN